MFFIAIFKKNIIKFKLLKTNHFLVIRQSVFVLVILKKCILIIGYKPMKLKNLILLKYLILFNIVKVLNIV